MKGEWSFIETLRHLVFVTDCWIGDVVLEQPSPYDPIGLPPDFITNGRDLGLDLDARPSLVQVLGARDQHVGEVREVLSRTTIDELDRRCQRLDGRFTVYRRIPERDLRGVAHHYYATRDLAARQ